jgi:hypothetical protein
VLFASYGATNTGFIYSGSASQFKIRGYTNVPLTLGSNNDDKWSILSDAAGTSSFKSSSAIGQIIGGATSLAFRNNANNADNVFIADAGGILLRGATGGTPAVGVINAQGFKINGVDVSTSSDTFWTADAAGIAYAAGAVGVGGASNAANALRVSSTALTGTTQTAIVANTTFSNAATVLGRGVYGQVLTAAAAFTMTEGAAFYAAGPSIGAGSAITSLYGLYVANQGAASITNAYGVYISAQSGAATTNIGLYNLGTTRLDGAVGLGIAPAGAVALYVRNNNLTGTGQTGVAGDPEFTSAATASGTSVYGRVRTAAAAFTVSAGSTFYADAPTIGAGSAITTQYGFYAVNQGKAGVTNAYGVYIAAQSGAATTNIGLYNAGTTQLVGNAAIGTTVNTAILLNISGSLTGTGYGVQIAVDATGTVSSAVVNAIGTTSGAGNRDHIAGFQSACVHNGTGTMTSMYGAYVGDTLTAGAGTVSYYYGTRINAPSGTGVVTTTFGHYIAAMTRGATSNYGIYIEAPSGGATNIGLYNAGTTTLVGNTTPVGRLVVPMGEINYFSLVGTAVSIAGVSDGSTNLVKAAPTTALTTGAYQFDNGGANDGRLRYTGATTKMFHVAASVSFSGGNGDTFVVGFLKNGSLVTTATRVLRKMGASGDVGSTALHADIELATNEYIEVAFGNTTDTDDPTVHALNLFALGM